VVTQADGKKREHRPPVPLATLEMQKRVTRELRLPGERVMKLAEELYQAGFISYPRTETDRFSSDYDLKVMTTLLPPAVKLVCAGVLAGWEAADLAFTPFSAGW